MPSAAGGPDFLTDGPGAAPSAGGAPGGVPLRDDLGVRMLLDVAQPDDLAVRGRQLINGRQQQQTFGVELVGNQSTLQPEDRAADQAPDEAEDALARLYTLAQALGKIWRGSRRSSVVEPAGERWW